MRSETWLQACRTPGRRVPPRQDRRRRHRVLRRTGVSTPDAAKRPLRQHMSLDPRSAPGGSRPSLRRFPRRASRYSLTERRVRCGPTTLLAVGAGRRNPHRPAHSGRCRQSPRRRRRRRGWGRRIVSLPDIAGVVRALGNIARTLGHPVPGVANVHIPLDTLVRPTLIHIQGIPRAPVIWAVAARAPGTVARLGGTCQPETGHTQAARHQRRCCQTDEDSFHWFSFRRCLPEAGHAKVAAGALENSCGAAHPEYPETRSL